MTEAHLQGKNASFSNPKEFAEHVFAADRVITVCVFAPRGAGEVSDGRTAAIAIRAPQNRSRRRSSRVERAATNTTRSRTLAEHARLDAYIDDQGDLVIEGQDLGAGVEHFFGVREYEWMWTVQSTLFRRRLVRTPRTVMFTALA